MTSLVGFSACCLLFLISASHSYDQLDTLTDSLLRDVMSRMGGPEDALAVNFDDYPNLPSNLSPMQQAESRAFEARRGCPTWQRTFYSRSRIFAAFQPMGQTICTGDDYVYNALGLLFRDDYVYNALGLLFRDDYVYNALDLLFRDDYVYNALDLLFRDDYVYNALGLLFRDDYVYNALGP
ncbi:c-terminal peptide [Caerostris extrusa]|uniref:C-terminal peptide n=1 Tax=Caerostris extrusa TaxID=172846 RepID=A0AAV4N7C3_CAEEX|nr:c-terminal peptide [Caerostris extrusa]